MALHTLTYAQVRREVGRFLQIDEDTDNWSALDITQVDDFILRGSRLFYFPPVTMIADKALLNHSWSFCVESTSVTLADATTYHDLPADFIRFTGRPHISGSEYPLEPISEEDLRNLANASAGVGDPQYFYIRYSTAQGVFQVGVHPQPVGSMTLEGEQLYDPTVASAAQDPILPANHAETYLAAIFYVADKMFNDPPNSKLEEEFKELLAASIMADKGIGG